jgi:hypothetical protein
MVRRNLSEEFDKGVTQGIRDCILGFECRFKERPPHSTFADGYYTGYTLCKEGHLYKYKEDDQ